MKTRTILTAKRDDEFGGIGLCIPGTNPTVTFNPAQDGLTVAHDLIEHVNGPREIGTIDDELEALGAVWFVRGQFSDLNRDGRGSAYTAHENIASDITRMFRDFFYGSYVSLSVPRTRACEADDDFREIIECAVKEARSELNDDEIPEEVAHKQRMYMAVCLPRMRIGYRKAKRKYKHGRDANRLFWEIADAVDPYAKRCEFEGQQFELIYGFDAVGGIYARCSEYYREDYE